MPSSFKKGNEIAVTADSDLAAQVAKIRAMLKKGVQPPVTLPPDASLTDKLLLQMIQQLADIQNNTRAGDTGSLPGAGWYVDEYFTSLPNQSDNIIAAGQTLTVVDEPTEEGELYNAVLMTDNQYLNFYIQVVAPDGTKQTVQASPWLFQQNGNTQANTRVPYLTRYDTTNGVYSVIWAPNPSIPYRGVKAYLTNPPVLPVLVPQGVINSSTPNVQAHVMTLVVNRRVFG